MCALRPSVSAHTTLPMALSDLLIILPSSMVRPSALVLSCLSDPVYDWACRELHATIHVRITCTNSKEQLGVQYRCCILWKIVASHHELDMLLPDRCNTIMR